MNTLSKILMSLAVAGLSAQAGTLLINDTTVGEPTWNRPVAGDPPTPPASAAGTAVPYDVTIFHVDTTASYSFLMTGTDPTNWDTYAFLYQGGFDALAPFTNVLVGNDDNPTMGLSGFTRSLTAGATYVFVATGFGNTDQGAYSLFIEGAGTILPGPGTGPDPGGDVPEPATPALVVAGLAGLLTARRLRRR